ncbi:MAG: BrxA family protein [Acidiferrobacter sp.]
MTPLRRANIASSFTIVKGALINETYAVLAAWDLSRSKRENLDRLRQENFVGARTATWLRDLAKVLNRRFEPEGRDRALVMLAQSGCDLLEWKPILLWHITRDEFLLRDFLQNWLFPAYESGLARVNPAEVREYLRDTARRGGVTEHPWSETTLERVAAGLLKMAVEFGLLRGKAVKTFNAYSLPERSFLYLLHVLRETHPNPRKNIEAPDWRMYLMRPADVEHEILRLHQFHKLDYQVAGSLAQMKLPCATSAQYAERMVA